MRTPDTGQLDLFEPAHFASRSGAVAPLIAAQPYGQLRLDDVICAIDGSTPRTVPTPGIRTSTTATRTTGTRTTRTEPGPSAAETGAGFSFGALVAAWLDCRSTKRTTPSALAFEARSEAELLDLYEALTSGTYTPGRSTCFVIRHPKPREVWAADFRDRVVHHLLYNHIGSAIERTFIADSCACIPGRGTLYGARRLEQKARAITANWTRPAHYLKCDLANFFVSIDKRILDKLLAARIVDPWWLQLARTILWHDPRTDAQVNATNRELRLIAAHKSLFNQPEHCGLPIGNLSSQFYANVYLDVLDQFIKHRLRVRHYVRYVDDFILLHESPQQLNTWLTDITAFLPRELAVHINPAKTILQPVARGIDFVGQVVKPWRRVTRRRTLNAALDRLERMPTEDLYEAGNSYLGLLRQASHSHHDRCRVANTLRRRGLAVDHRLTKAYPSTKENAA